MPRCQECSKVVVSKDFEAFKRERTWSSGPELIELAEAGCDLCSFIRKHLEKVSQANLQRLKRQPAIVLRDCYSKITLNYYFLSLTVREYRYLCLFFMEPASISTQSSDLETPYDPILCACQLLNACVLGGNDGHGECGAGIMDLPTKVASLPRRLLDLSHNDNILTLDVPSWIATAGATVDELSNYCTLSYRWGKKPPDCMLSEGFVRERAIPFASMPQTFQDAIIVARSLKIRFLWIDALCIVQPSAHGDYTDWNAEGPRMWLVYQNAVCTIAATCSDNPDNGFLSKCGTDNILPCSIPEEGTKLPLFFSPPSRTSRFHSSVVASSLNRRGWVAQERLLSRRILHFTEEGVFWECQEANIDLNDVAVLGGEVGSQHASRLNFSKWLSFIEFYSASEFTQPTDRLIALSSIARSVPVEQFGNAYFAGIWREHLLECLCWGSVNPCTVISRLQCLNIAPSWSWASVPDQIRYERSIPESSSKYWVEIEHVSISLAQADNPYGNLKESALKLHARLCSMSLPTQNKFFSSRKGPDIPEIESVEMENVWDEEQGYFPPTSIYVVVPLCMWSYDSFTRTYHNALVVSLLPLTAEENASDLCRVYRRIGYIKLRINWRNLSTSNNEEGKTGYVRPSPQAMFDIFFPNTTPQTIVLK